MHDVLYNLNEFVDAVNISEVGIGSEKGCAMESTEALSLGIVDPALRSAFWTPMTSTHALFQLHFAFSAQHHAQLFGHIYLSSITTARLSHRQDEIFLQCTAIGASYGAYRRCDGAEARDH